MFPVFDFHQNRASQHRHRKLLNTCCNAMYVDSMMDVHLHSANCVYVIERLVRNVIARPLLFRMELHLLDDTT